MARAKKPMVATALMTHAKERMVSGGLWRLSCSIGSGNVYFDYEKECLERSTSQGK